MRRSPFFDGASQSVTVAGQLGKVPISAQDELMRLERGGRAAARVGLV
jgi:hypothetical protein